MITKIKDISGTDAFDSFTWNAADCARLNLIYGWNGSGKTTVSRVLNFLERRSVHLPDLTGIEFGVQTSNGLLKRQQLANHSLSIRVFNEDFIRENVTFSSGQAKKILIIGKENIALVTEITTLEAQQVKRQQELDALLGRKPGTGKLETALTDAAREVTKQFGNTPLANDRYYGRSYNKARVDAKLKDGTVTAATMNKCIVAQDALDVYRDAIKNERSAVDADIVPFPDCAELFTDANSVLSTIVHFQDVGGLKDDKSLRDWTEGGYALHRERTSDVCLFCKSSLGPGLLAALGSFFTDEMTKMKAAIGLTLATIDGIRAQKGSADLDSAGLLPEIVSRFLAARESLQESIDAIHASLDALADALREKLDHLHGPENAHVSVAYPKGAVDDAQKLAVNLRELLEEHNRLVATNAERTALAAKTIELHTIATLLLNREYFEKRALIARIEEQAKPIQEALDAAARTLHEKRAALHDANIAVDRINTLMKTFFGDGQLYLELADPKKGEGEYLVKSRGKNARHLSEGEKSVLALVYFIVKLEEDGCDKKTCAVIIDDPVDSQDGVFLFRTFGLIRAQLGDAGQLIVLTHNFEFFNLVRDWFHRPAKKGEAEFFLIRLDKGANGRSVVVDDLPPILREHKSEYRYLFARLYQFANGGPVLEAPLVANVGRKVLEYFASFKWSCKSPGNFTNVVQQRFVESPDPHRKGIGEFIVKFLHEYSHGEDFARPIAASTFEAKPVAEQILTFIRLADPEHYDELAAQC